MRLPWCVVLVLVGTRTYQSLGLKGYRAYLHQIFRPSCLFVILSFDMLALK